MHQWSDIRRRLLTGELSLRQAAAESGLNFRTVRKTLEQVRRLRAADRVDETVLPDAVADSEGTIRGSFELPMPGLSLINVSPISGRADQEVSNR